MIKCRCLKRESNTQKNRDLGGRMVNLGLRGIPENQRRENGKEPEIMTDKFPEFKKIIKN